jgi:hypothetical protein
MAFYPAAGAELRLFRMGLTMGRGRFRRFFANKEHGISTHRTSQKTFSFSEIDGDEDEFTNVTGPILPLEPTNFVRTVALWAR